MPCDKRFNWVKNPISKVLIIMFWRCEPSVCCCDSTRLVILSGRWIG